MYSPVIAEGDFFCRDVLDSYDFEQGVFAGPDPDALPNKIHQYIRTRIEHQVNMGQLTGGEADYFLESAMDEMNMFRNIADNCRREPGLGIRLIDKLIKPHLHSSTLSQHQAKGGNQVAHETLDALWQACQVFWMEQDTPAMCTLEDLAKGRGNSFHPPAELEIIIEDGSLSGFSARARHLNGNREYLMNAQGDVFETTVAGHPSHRNQD